MKIMITALIFSTIAHAQDPFSSAPFEEKPRSNDVALVLVNEHDGKVVEGFTGFAFDNMLSSHYPRKNIIKLTQKEMDNCSRLLRAPGSDFACRQLKGEACATDSSATEGWGKGMKSVSESAACPQFEQLRGALETGDSIDAYAATHGGIANSLIRFTKELGIRSDVAKKFRMFYSMGCEDASKGDDSYAVKGALASGFATFVGHKGFSISPVAFNSFKTRLGMGEDVGTAVAKVNEGIKASVLSKGTLMHVAGDPSTSTRRKPRLSTPSKQCLGKRGKASLSELSKIDGCVDKDVIAEYFYKYPDLMDAAYCDSISESNINKLREHHLAMPLCASLGRTLASGDRALSWSSHKYLFLHSVKEGLPCGDGDIARALYCFSQWAGGDVNEFRKEMAKDPELKLRAAGILNQASKLTPKSCKN